MQSNTYWLTGIRIGGFSAGTVLSKTISVDTDAIDHAATALGVTLSAGSCIELKVLYKTGNTSSPNNKIATTLSNSIENPPFTLGSLTVSGGVITSGTPENYLLDITNKGVLEYYEGATHIINLSLLSGVNRIITLKNEGYGDLTSFSFGPSPSSSYGSQFSANTCNTTLSSGAQCTISYTGTMPSGNGYLKAAFNNGTQSEKILPFNIQAPGGAKAWGYNSYGQLGDGSTTNRTTPVDVSTLSSGVVQISAGVQHACALLDTGAMKCWGRNIYGQLGNGTTTQSTTPVDVSTLSSGVAQISAGGTHTCALLDTGAVKCWGHNNFGQLGDGTASNSTTPVNVSTLSSGVVQISAGQYYTCALLNTGAMKCWGYNANGQLGNGTITNSITPVDVSALSCGVARISAESAHTCALLDTGAMKCWGYNALGQLGNGTKTQSTTPVDVSTLSSGVAQISTGGTHTCALLDTGAMKCWGSNAFGQLGDGTTTQRTTPVNVSTLSSGVVQISLERLHTCALLDTGAMKCWGYNGFGQLGDGTTSNRTTPVDVMSLSGIKQISSYSGMSDSSFAIV